jgi:hypothetical protein
MVGLCNIASVVTQLLVTDPRLVHLAMEEKDVDKR